MIQSARDVPYNSPNKGRTGSGPSILDFRPPWLRGSSGPQHNPYSIRDDTYLKRGVMLRLGLCVLFMLVRAPD